MMFFPDHELADVSSCVQGLHATGSHASHFVQPLLIVTGQMRWHRMWHGTYVPRLCGHLDRTSTPRRPPAPSAPVSSRPSSSSLPPTSGHHILPSLCPPATTSPDPLSVMCWPPSPRIRNACCVWVHREVKALPGMRTLAWFNIGKGGFH
ncbi:hypothetical protein NHX12_011783 [Muraenolepis orangiensis]|uniref:Uncharacterized protein n=1 Tax=Muraenolepis orangiensis TaxID=630683 RepID=A0A9Q0I721_9TELE|nr:hypothetical protein NHX12_011783 [Muraenolepis orangiensis]